MGPNPTRARGIALGISVEHVIQKNRRRFMHRPKPDGGARYVPLRVDLDRALGDVLGEVPNPCEIAGKADGGDDLAEIHRHRLAPNPPAPNPPASSDFPVTNSARASERNGFKSSPTRLIAVRHMSAPGTAPAAVRRGARPARIRDDLPEPLSPTMSRNAMPRGPEGPLRSPSATLLSCSMARVTLRSRPK